MMTDIATARLLLRPHEPADAEALLRGVGNLNVSLLGNEASRRILDGLGFVPTGEGESFSRARNAQTRVMHLRLEKKGRRA